MPHLRPPLAAAPEDLRPAPAIEVEQGANVQSTSSLSLSDQIEHNVAPLVPNSEPPLHAPPRQTDRPVRDRPSIGRRIFRAFVRFFIAVLIGVGATLAWQSYGDEAREAVRNRAPSLAWLLPATTPKSMQQLEPITRDLVAVRSSLEQLAVKQEQMARAMPSFESVQQPEPITRDLAAVRSSLDQLAVKQEQMAQNIATLQTAIERNMKQTMSSPLPSQAVPLPPRKPHSPPPSH
jgi:hypothetical protein